ncbi:MAG: RiPP maturation radical SAM C-methyltransferase [Deltaproteobacteria bacterium]|nr:RiPP maturation radical SAM C-methyltransferase [Deltaproteobacteria bacterium]
MKILDKVLSNADGLLIIPPFGFLNIPNLSIHLLKDYAKKAGYNFDILYLNLLLANEIGEYDYLYLSKFSNKFTAERLFARVAYNDLVCQNKGNNDLVSFQNHIYEKLKNEDIKYEFVDTNKIIEFESKIDKWIDNIINKISEYNYKIVGCTTTFEQTSASIAFLNAIKKKNNNIITILGGANCEGEMAEGIFQLSSYIDYIFSGESEITFLEFLKNFYNEKLPNQKIIKGLPLKDLDELPALDYSEYFRQLQIFIPKAEFKKNNPIMLPYETNRGCWKGEKQKCLFCGLNGENIKFRYKSHNIALNELKILLKKNPIRRVFMIGNIMPNQYFESLLPNLADNLPDLKIFSEVRSNLSLEKLILVKKAGFTRLQAGIESLSTGLLKKMRKGVSAVQNIRFLKHAKILNISVDWNMLYAFPNDSEKDYADMYKILPFIYHLIPPVSQTPFVIQRFSPYFDFPDKFNIKNVIPFPVYKEFIPSSVNINKTAYNFLGEFNTAWNKETTHYWKTLETNNILKSDNIISKVFNEVTAWQKAWADKEPPKLELKSIGDNRYMLIDTRNISENKDIRIIDLKKAIAATIDFSKTSKEKNLFKNETEWAIKRKLILKVDRSFISIVTTNIETFKQLQCELNNFIKND